MPAQKEPHPALPELEGFLLHPVRIPNRAEADAAKTSFLQANERPCSPEPQGAVNACLP